MKGCSSNFWAVGRANGSRCKHNIMKFFASFDRCSGISGISLLFPILNMAATCQYNIKKNWSFILIKQDHTFTRLDLKYPISYPFILTPRRLRRCHFNKCASQAPYINWKAIAICVHYNLRKTLEYNSYGEIEEEGRICLHWKKFHDSREKNKLTSGAIQYGLPLNESIEAAEVICSRKIKSQKIHHNSQTSLNINYFLKRSKLYFLHTSKILF